MNFDDDIDNIIPESRKPKDIDPESYDDDQTDWEDEDDDGEYDCYK